MAESGPETWLLPLADTEAALAVIWFYTEWLS